MRLALVFFTSLLFHQSLQDVQEGTSSLYAKLLIQRGSLHSVATQLEDQLVSTFESHGVDLTEFKQQRDASNLINLLGPAERSLYYAIKMAFLQLNEGSFPVPLPPELQDDFLLRLLGSMTPIFYAGEQCSKASWTYLYNMFVQGGGAGGEDQIPWAIKMFDSTGKLPDAMYSDTLDFCQILDDYGPALGQAITCELIQSQFSLPFSLRGIVTVPVGNTYAYGSFDGCLSIKSNIFAMNGSNPLGLEKDFHGAWYSSKFDRITESPGKKQPRLTSGFNAIGGIANELIGIQLPQTISGVLDMILGVFFMVGDLRVGTCIPDTCSYMDIIYNNATLMSSYKMKMTFTSEILTEETKRVEMDTFGKTMLVIFSIIGVMLVLGTLVELWQEMNPFPIKQKGPESFPVKLFKCFSILKNGRAILNTDTGKNHLNSMSGIRTISMSWIIYGHLYMFTQQLAMLGPGLTENRKFTEDVRQGRAGWFYELLLNAYPSVDTFFLMSGLLVAYLSFIEMERKRFNLKLFYIHRYLRLGIPLALAIAFQGAFGQLMNYGPIFKGATQGQIDNCRNYGWRNLLYIMNFFPREEACLGQTWYLANDMQFYVLSPILLYPLFRQPKLGYAIAGGIYTVLTFLMGYLTVHYQLAPSDTFNSHMTDFNTFQHFYIVPWTRFQPYLIGILVGYYLYRTRNSEVKIPHVLNLVLWQLSLITMFAVIFGLYGLRLNDHGNADHTWTTFEAVLYQCFHKTAWSLALAWIIVSCHKGYGGIINDFLSWKAFVPLSKLTYGAYLIHISAQFIVMFGLTSTIYLTDLFISQLFIGFFCFTFGAAFVFSLSMELPFANLEKLLLTGAAGTRALPVKKPEVVQVNGNGVVKEEVKENMEKIDTK